MPAPALMAILNATPDSFSDGGLHLDPGAAVDHALQMAQEGAAWIDVGGESTRPGAARVSAKEQIARVAPVLTCLRLALDTAGFQRVGLSIDTTQAQVAQVALDLGATLINDVSAGEDDPALLPLAAQAGATVCLMHKRGQPASMQAAPVYGDVVAEVKAYLLDRAHAAEQAGVARDKIWLDPGIGFGKTLAHNLALMRALPELVATGFPVLLGASRKKWIAELEGDAPDPHNRVGGSVASTLWAAQCGVAVVRVHEMVPHRQVLATWQALQG